MSDRLKTKQQFWSLDHDVYYRVFKKIIPIAFVLERGESNMSVEKDS
jgi:hypothetical protein